LSTKNLVLSHLEKNKGKALSGEAIAGELGVSRNAVWKAISELRREGYDIEASTNRGYTLTQSPDILSADGIRAGFENQALSGEIFVFEQLESTNKTAKELAGSGAAHGTAVFAKRQTGGIGRFGRSFISPPGGIYMSLVLRPDFLNFENLTTTTAAAAVCVCRALEGLGLAPQIKWVNDVFLNRKKICGILTEAVTDFESGTVGWIVLGIGINFSVSMQDMPSDLSQTAACVFPDGSAPISQNAFAVTLLELLLSCFAESSDAEVYAQYKARMLALGEEILVKQGDALFSATALDINESGHLIVKTKDGDTLALSSGEVSIRI